MLPLKVEEFIIGKSPDVSYISSFYGDDFDDYDRLKLHRDVFVDYAKSKEIELEDFESALAVLHPSDGVITPITGIISELVKLVKIVLCMPVTSCTCERSFSSLCRLETYLRTTMTQERLNHLAILNTPSDIARNIELSPLMDEFIKRVPVRMNTFAIGN